MKRDLLEDIRSGKSLSTRDQIFLTARLSLPSILAQISTVVMEYIDASMVGHLGSEASAAIGLVSSSTWLLGGLCAAASIGYTVQVAHRIGAKKEKEARALVRQGLLSVLVFSFLLLIIGAGLSSFLPDWLGGSKSITKDASRYFLIYALTLPFFQLHSTAGGMLQCSGNMRIPSILNILMCVLDVIFNGLLIFPGRQVSLLGFSLFVPGAGLGVAGAALGTSLSQIIIALMMLWFLLFRSPSLRIRKGERAPFKKEILVQAIRISLPVGAESFIMGGAYVIATRIVSPLGNIALAANSFAVTAEGLCYMPGYGIATAATTLIGQSIGAGRRNLAKHLGWITTLSGMVVMTGTGVLMYVFAPQMIGILSPDPEIVSLGAQVLRIEAFAEPFFAASIVASGAFRGAGDTLVPSILNFCSMWLVRLTLAAFLAPRLGLPGVWIAMCIELIVRGSLFLGRMVLHPLDRQPK